jgi:hypothetical protein
LSNYLAIAGVSSTLRTLLRDRMTNPVPVTIAPPDATISGSTGQRVNLYLYQITENAYLKNQEIPGEGYPGAHGHPPLSLNLYYLATGYGSSETAADGDLDAQQVLGDAMRVLHDYAIITPDLTITRPSAGTVGDPILDTSLRNEFERVKLMMVPSSLDDLSKLWMALSEVNFRRSVTYEVSVVQIQSQLPRRRALPVKTRRLHAALVRRPEISEVYRTPVNPGDPVGDVRAKIGDNLTIEGRGFKAPKTWVRLGGVDPIGVAPSSDGRIQLPVPDDVRLQPGPQVVEVLTQRSDEVVQGGLDKGQVVTDQSLTVSNQSVFMLVPGIGSLNPSSGPAATTQLTVNGSRLFNQGLKSFLLIGDVEIPVAPPQTPISITVPLAALAAAAPSLATNVDYPVRVQVNGALSAEDNLIFTLTP